MKSKVVVLRCSTYDNQQVFETVKKGVELLGGIDKFFDKEEKILLKPNLLASTKPEKAATTHPAVFRAVAKLLRDNKYENLSYGDSPGFGDTKKVAYGCGLGGAVEEFDLNLADFSDGVRSSVPDGKICKQFVIANGVLETDGIINVCKMKSHAFQRVTGAVKNTFGAVYGFNKGGMHVKYGNAYDFAQMIVDLNKLVKPRLHIMDGIVAMEGSGPRGGDPVEMNVILLSADPFALDSVFCKLIDLDPKLIPAIIYGADDGLGVYKEEDIELIGDDLEPLVNKEFNIPRVKLKSEDIRGISGMRKLFLRKPYIKEDKCIKCGICVESCPLDDKAITFSDGSQNIPQYEYNKCIRCFCCQELCPYEAIGVKVPLLSRIFDKRN